MSWDDYVEVRGNRYNVPCELVGQHLAARIGLVETLRVYHADIQMAQHTLKSRAEGWITITEHHLALWQAVQVKQHALSAYEEVTYWNWKTCSASYIWSNWKLNWRLSANRQLKNSWIIRLFSPNRCKL